MNRLTINGYEYDMKTSQKGKAFSELEIPKNAELWTIDDFKLFSPKQYEKLGLLEDWFFIEQFSSYWKAQGRVADSDVALLNCSGYPQYSYASLGVRFKYKISENPKKKAELKKVYKTFYKKRDKVLDEMLRAEQRINKKYARKEQGK